jgi:2-succinyl-5-enolpyruvyl-6-hydroxy-3-cyclohexene-1-carboxylate synthase
MISDKQGIEHLSLMLIAHDVRHIVISPGSRNAPLIATFTNYKAFDCYSIVDERSAAFFALGIAQKTGKTVALTCTSGSALLNYAPALAEAYYQKIPLLVISADRPENLIDRGDGQTIRQQNIYANYIRESVHLPENPETTKELIDFQKLALKAIQATQFPIPGPAHINIPFAEPIYGTKEKDNPEIIPFTIPHLAGSLHSNKMASLLKIWNSSKRIMILVGQQKENKALEEQLIKISKNQSVTVLTETTSNLSAPNFINCIDKTLASIPNDKLDFFRPDLLISLNSNIVSKRIKAFLRNEKNYTHWHIDLAGEELDSYFHLDEVLKIKPESFFEILSSSSKNAKSDFQAIWNKQKEKAKQNHEKYLKNLVYSDLKVFDILLKQLPSHSRVHFANSTPVRYSQLFNLNPSLKISSNRGTSGIDGSVSTAVGAAWHSEEITSLITGDLSFFYDSNALWNHYVSKKLRLIVINNGGGGIFRFIDGPSSLPSLEDFFETKNQRSAKSLAEEAQLDYFAANTIDGLKEALKTFFDLGNRAKLLEIFTPKEINAEILRNYFKAMA